MPNLLTIPRKRAGVNEIDLNPGEIFTRLLPDAVPFGVFARSEFLFGVPAGFVPSPAGARADVFLPLSLISLVAGDLASQSGGK